MLMYLIECIVTHQRLSQKSLGCIRSCSSTIASLLGWNPSQPWFVIGYFNPAKISPFQGNDSKTCSWQKISRTLIIVSSTVTRTCISQFCTFNTDSDEGTWFLKYSGKITIGIKLNSCWVRNCWWVNIFCIRRDKNPWPNAWQLFLPKPPKSTISPCLAVQQYGSDCVVNCWRI